MVYSNPSIVIFIIFKHLSNVQEIIFAVYCACMVAERLHVCSKLNRFRFYITQCFWLQKRPETCICKVAQTSTLLLPSICSLSLHLWPSINKDFRDHFHSKDVSITPHQCCRHTAQRLRINPLLPLLATASITYLFHSYRPG